MSLNSILYVTYSNVYNAAAMTSRKVMQIQLPRIVLEIGGCKGGSRG
jgi:hypothetical protein